MMADDEMPAELLDEAYAMDELITEVRSPEAQAERVAATAALVEAENAAAPSEEEVERLYASALLPDDEDDG